MYSGISRRVLLRKTALGGLGLPLLDSSRSAYSYQANEKLNVALIGVGGRGRWFLDTIPRMENVVALCDVDNRKLTEDVEAAESYEYLNNTSI